MSKKEAENPSLEEKVANALNEQGFLFSMAMRDKVCLDRPGKGIPQKGWKVVASEFPVTAADGFQTRVDILLEDAAARGILLCLECKRSHPAYKQWVFFDPDPQNSYFFESFTVQRLPLKSSFDAHHGVSRQAVGDPATPVFNLYIEVAVKRDGHSGHTETIEDACRQAIRGQTGVIAKHLEFEKMLKVVAVPIVVTTAQLFEAQFDTHNVELSTGTIKANHLKLKPLPYCAVNYHADDALHTKSQYAPPSQNLEHDLAFRTVRTVFVVGSEKLTDFLIRLNGRIIH